MQQGKYGSWDVKDKALLAFQVRWGSSEREAVKAERSDDGAGTLELRASRVMLRF